MIQIQGRHQFKGAAARLQRERMAVSRHEAGKYNVENRTRGTRYMVSFIRIEGRVFGTCTCPAGLPLDGNRVPKVCKHLLAGLLFHNAINAQRKAAKVAPAPVPAFDDEDHPDYWEANY